MVFADICRLEHVHSVAAPCPQHVDQCFLRKWRGVMRRKIETFDD